MKKAKHSERAHTQRTDVEWIDGVPYCQTCNRYVDHADCCTSDCSAYRFHRQIDAEELRRQVAYFEARCAELRTQRDDAEAALKTIRDAIKKWESP